VKDNKKLEWDIQEIAINVLGMNPNETIDLEDVHSGLFQKYGVDGETYTEIIKDALKSLHDKKPLDEDVLIVFS